MDYAAATPVSDSVFAAMQSFWKDNFHNPSSLYRESLIARDALSRARSTIAEMLHIPARTIIFTAGGTEANNMAIQGVIKQYKKIYPKTVPHVVISAIEHQSVRDVCLYLKMKGEILLEIIPVDSEGIVDLKKLKSSLQENTALVSIGYANSEIGVIQPMREIAKIIRHARKDMRRDRDAVYPVFHSDAIAAGPYLSLNPLELGVDSMSVSAAKMYGPKGIAFLYLRDGIHIEPIIIGGGQEDGLRSGTENVPLVVGFAQALKDATEKKEQESARLIVLQQYFYEQIEKLNTQLVQNFNFLKSPLLVNGSRTVRLPNNVNISLEKLNGEHIVLEFDARGILVSSRAACSSGDTSGSHVIDALGLRGDTDGSVRFTFGRETKKSDIDRVIVVFQQILEKLYGTVKRFDDTL